MAVFAALLASALALAPGASPAPRGNSVLARGPQRVLSVGVTMRLGLLIGGGDVLFSARPPVGFGFGLQLKYHALNLGPVRFGFEFHGGHTRFLRYDRFDVPAPPVDPSDPSAMPGFPGRITRVSLLTHTDLTLGPSFQIPAGPLVIDVGGGAGLAISNYRDARAPNAARSQTVAYDPMVRAGAAIGVPIRNNHGLVLGVDYQKFFSRTKVVTDPAAPPGAPPDSVVFDMLLNITLGYQAWF